LMTERFIKVAGKMITCLATVDLLSPTLTMKETLRMDLPMERAISKIKTLSTLDNGDMISGMDSDRNNLSHKKENLQAALLIISIRERENLKTRIFCTKANSRLVSFKVKG